MLGVLDLDTKQDYVFDTRIESQVYVYYRLRWVNPQCSRGNAVQVLHCQDLSSKPCASLGVA